MRWGTRTGSCFHGQVPLQRDVASVQTAPRSGVFHRRRLPRRSFRNGTRLSVARRRSIVRRVSSPASRLLCLSSSNFETLASSASQRTEPERGTRASRKERKAREDGNEDSPGSRSSVHAERCPAPRPADLQLLCGLGVLCARPVPVEANRSCEGLKVWSSTFTRRGPSRDGTPNYTDPRGCQNFFHASPKFSVKIFFNSSGFPA